MHVILATVDKQSQMLVQQLQISSKLLIKHRFHLLYRLKLNDNTVFNKKVKS